MEVVRREDIYDKLETTTQDLLIKLYGSREDFINTIKIYEIDKYILAYDNNLGNKNIVFNLLVRVGGCPNEGDDVSVFAYKFFDEYIDYVHTQSDKYPPVESFIDLPKSKFPNFMLKYYPDVNLLINPQSFFDQRTIYLLQLYRNPRP